MPALSARPPSFEPVGRYTEERMKKLDAAHPAGFLWDEERKLMHHFMALQNDAFAWHDLERGYFRSDFFPPIEFPVIPHTPWIQKNIPIPPGIYDEVCAIIRKKVMAGVYEPSNSSYRSRWFCVLKKDGKSLRIVHSLEPLNAVTIKHSGVTPIPDHMAEQFAARACGATFDLYVGYDERLIAETSRDLTTFQTPFGAMRLVTLPMGWTNSVPIFQDDVTYILQPEIPDWTIPYIDDVAVKGPASRYQRADGSYETIADNPGIRRFVWEHFQNLNRIVQRMKYCGGTFSGIKLALCVEEITVVGHVCGYQGRVPDKTKVAVIQNWGYCHDLSDVRAFLGTVGLCRIFIRNFAHRAHALVKLTRKAVPFEFGEEQIAAQIDLKEAVLNSPALRPIDYQSEAPVILAVDTSHIAVGFYTCQCDVNNARIRYYNRFGSITLNERESRFSQPKLEIYGLFRALRAQRLYIIGVRNLVIEVDARYIKGMLNNPDIVPSASINRWILSILTFHFDLVHVPASNHGPDGLSRRVPQPGDGLPPEDEEQVFDDWIDNLYGFMHQINDISPKRRVLALSLAEPLDNTSTQHNTPQITYENVPRSNRANLEDARLLDIREWLENPMVNPPHAESSEARLRFMRYASNFFVFEDKLWRKRASGAHQLVIVRALRMRVLESCHNDVGHKGVFATCAHILERFWWPNLSEDVAWFVRTCHPCQLRQLRQVVIPPVVTRPASLFSKVYVDTMHLPPSRGFKFLVQARCSLSHYPEFAMMKKENAQNIGDFLFENLLCRWGTLSEIVTDNGSAFIKAMEYLARKYKINHVTISGYNSRANGIVERTHFDVRQSLFKAADGDSSRWANVAHSVFWAERVTVRKRMGCSPYFVVTGTHPIIPLDVVEATYLQPPPSALISTTDLIIRCTIALQKHSDDLSRIYSKVYQARRDAARCFERTYPRNMKDFDFKRGDLVLLRNSAIEKSLNRKMCPRYTGPLVVLACNFGGAYILAELDGSVFHRPIAAFRLLPYFARKKIAVPSALLDIDEQRLRELRASTDIDADGDGYLSGSVSDISSDDETPSD